MGVSLQGYHFNLSFTEICAINLNNYLQFKSFLTFSYKYYVCGGSGDTRYALLKI